MKDKSNVGQSWNEKCLEGKTGYGYSSLSASEVKKFRGTAEIRRLVSLLNAVTGHSALEAGCGSGKFSLSIASYGFHVTAMDYTWPPLKNISQLSKALKIGNGRVSFVCGDITAMPFGDSSYDMAFNEGVVEHWLDKGERVAVIREMVRVVRPGGLVVIYVPNGGHPFHEKWVRTGYPGYLSAPPMTLYDFKKLKAEMEEAGLRDVEVDGIMASYSFNQWPYRSWLRLPIAALNRYFPLPRAIRSRWGIHLLGIGRK